MIRAKGQCSFCALASLLVEFNLLLAIITDWNVLDVLSVGFSL